MRSRVEIVADATDGGRTVLPRLHAAGAFAARATGSGRGAAQVHLVGTAAGPLGGDVVEISVHVRPGARLALHGVAATIALPGRAAGGASLHVDVLVEDGASLHQDLPPVVVCTGADLRAETRLRLAGSARADLTEVVVLGRHGEPGGDWSGRLTVDRDGLPVLRTTQRSTVLRLGVVPARVSLSRFVSRSTDLTAPTEADTVSSTVGGAVRCALATGDVLVSALGDDVPTVVGDAAAALPHLSSPSRLR